MNRYLRRRVVPLAVAGVLLPSVGNAQQRRTLELGPVSYMAHNTLRYRYPGEAKWERALGARADLRVVRTRAGVIGLSAFADRYRYLRTLYTCTAGCTNDVARSSPTVTLAVAGRDVWTLSRIGGGLTLERPLAGPLVASVGLIAGETRRATVGQPMTDDHLYVAAREWFAGVEAGLGLRWRDLSVSAGGEYERVPDPDNYLAVLYYGGVPKVYHARFWLRTAYVLPLSRR